MNWSPVRGKLEALLKTGPVTVNSMSAHCNTGKKNIRRLLAALSAEEKAHVDSWQYCEAIGQPSALWTWGPGPDADHPNPTFKRSLPSITVKKKELKAKDVMNKMKGRSDVDILLYGLNDSYHNYAAVPVKPANGNVKSSGSGVVSGVHQKSNG